ncbi:chemotaxis protein CheW [Clostridium estertheticum]|uniref:chemotaxis protein CheW n=1 Tax=Clostridium estertheticum TaxID=238834 RepID=UPI001C6EEB2E|nr:chemotaxis protein CheW [Clostridium estertheticum]MBW9170617.1 chemotaxis protein CheW [Clostridium estertheticum]MBX4265149.1 chemotaxis protein CheW [Clostridium estertheticum]MBX4269188.1 chemotaxis protein CheW [Clostridium estertheticum]WLC74535.1 chemotaxis protein CheW [Clostridium estertheticum]WLC79453.1 chemotaxis protein CheW [Clostridium estertheticum]
MKQEDIKVLVFSVNGEQYATSILEVERILEYEKSTKVPDSPQFVEGVINYEDSILPVITLTKRFNLEASEIGKDSKIIVTKQKESKIGIIVDFVSEVKDVGKDNIEDSPEIITGISKRYIKGLIKIDGKIIIYLNISAILTDEEKTQIL